MSAHRSHRRSGVLLAVAAASTALAACGTAPEREPEAPAGGASGAASATSVRDLGGMQGLVDAAKAEGELNVIALPPDWANYGEVISTFQDKYGITVNSAQPDASSQDEINAAEQLRGTARAPDVFDLGPTVALANVDKFAPYQVETWHDVPEELKDPEGRWVNDYGGYMSIGYDAAKVPEPTTVEALLGPGFRNAVALNGDPTQAGAAFSGVVMTALGTGGSPDDVGPGIDFFGRLQDAGNFLPVDPAPATIAAGQTPVVIDWEYTNAAQTEALAGTPVDWRVVVPDNAVVGSYYVQAINAEAPHPAAARLWQEFLFSDEGQNLWLQGYARPVRAEAMEAAGTIDTEAYGKLPQPPDEPVFLTQEQTTAAQQQLTARWAAAVS